MNSDYTGKDDLTPAEAMVLSLVDTGLSNREIAATLTIAVGTVKCHLHRSYEKLQARNRTEAAVKAREQGLISAFVHVSTQTRGT